MKQLRIALTKGRLEKESVALFQRIGYNCENLINKGRKLVLDIPNTGLEVVLVKSADVITYVEHGVCDIGIVGKDTILESGKSFYEMLDLGFGRCNMVVATTRDKAALYSGYKQKKIATKYVEIARGFFEEKGMDVELIKIEGSVELAPILDLSDAIVDIVETGTTLKENGLEVIDTVCPISARLIVNLASMKLKKKAIMDFIDEIRKNLAVSDNA